MAQMLIDKQAAIDAMNARFEDIKLTWRGKVKKGEIAMYLDMRGVIETLPSAVPVRHGKWVFNPSDAIEAMFTTPKCSECGFESADGGNYCPNCGAKMG